MQFRFIPKIRFIFQYMCLKFIILRFISMFYEYKQFKCYDLAYQFNVIMLPRLPCCPLLANLFPTGDIMLASPSQSDCATH